MAAILDTTKSGTAANSYVTIGEATIYFETSSFGSTWGALATPDKTNRLIEAARALEAEFAFRGEVYVEGQALSFPRTHGLNVPEDANEIPVRVKHAQLELLRYQGEELNATGDVDRELNRVRIEGVLDVEFSQNSKDPGAETVSSGSLERVRSLLEPFLAPGSSRSSFPFSKF